MDMSSEPSSAKNNARYLRPWKPGECGTRRPSRAFVELFTELCTWAEASGVPLSIAERHTLEMAVKLKLRSFKDEIAATRAASVFRSIIGDIGRRRGLFDQPAPQAGPGDLHAYLARGSRS